MFFNFDNYDDSISRSPRRHRRSRIDEDCECSANDVLDIIKGRIKEYQDSFDGSVKIKCADSPEGMTMPICVNLRCCKGWIDLDNIDEYTVRRTLDDYDSRPYKSYNNRW